MKKEDLERKEILHDRELEDMEDRLEKFELEVRGQLDELRLELKAFRLFLECLDPKLKKTFAEIREKVFREVNPEEST